MSAYISRVQAIEWKASGPLNDAGTSNLTGRHPGTATATEPTFIFSADFTIENDLVASIDLCHIKKVIATTSPGIRVISATQTCQTDTDGYRIVLQDSCIRNARAY